MFLPRSFFPSDNWGDTFLRNISSKKSHTASHRRRRILLSPAVKTPTLPRQRNLDLCRPLTTSWVASVVSSSRIRVQRRTWPVKHVPCHEYGSVSVQARVQSHTWPVKHVPCHEYGSVSVQARVQRRTWPVKHVPCHEYGCVSVQARVQRRTWPVKHVPCHEYECVSVQATVGVVTHIHWVPVDALRGVCTSVLRPKPSDMHVQERNCIIVSMFVLVLWFCAVCMS
jgi:hypothetical protein